jgi:vitamin B12 transporter
MIRVFSTQALCLLKCVFVLAQNDLVQLDEVMVTDSRFERSVSKTGRSVTLLTSKDIEPFLGGTLADLLTNQVGIHINGAQSHPGSELSYFVRGGNNRQVLVLINGVPVSDPTQIENDFDLRTIDLSSIESVEIIRGASSSLYGSAAATAVIKITTTQPKQQSLSGSIRTIYGTNNDKWDFPIEPNFQTRQLQFALGNATHSGSISLSDQRTMGMSSVIGTEDDLTVKQNLSAQYQLQLSPQFRLNTIFTKEYFSSEYDDSFPALMDADNQFTSKSQRVVVQPKWTGESSSFVGRVSWATSSRDFVSSFPMYFEGDVMDVEGVFSTKLSTKITGLIGLNHKQQKAQFSDKVSVDLTDYFLNLLYEPNGFFEAQAGARLSEHSTYGSNWTYHINPSLYFDFNYVDLRFHTSLSTAFIAPSLYKLFDTYSGNQTLKPETNQSLEFGSSLFFPNGGQFQLVYFSRDHQNFVDYDMTTFRYTNAIRDFGVYGTEFLCRYPVTDRLLLQTNYTYTRHKEGEGLRIPKHKVNASFRQQFNSNTQLLTSIQFVGDRDDLAGQDLVVLSSYWLLDFRISHQLSQPGVSLFGSIENVFDADYEEVRGYTTRGRNLSFGVSYAF